MTPRQNYIRNSPTWLALSALLLVWFMASCKYFGGESPEAEWVTIKGTALSSVEPTTATLVASNPTFGPLASEEFRATVFQAKARASLPSVRASEPQRTAFAQVESRRSALRSLGESIIVHQPAGSNVNLSMILAAVSVENAGLEHLLEHGASVSFEPVPDSGAVEATAVLPGQYIADSILGSHLERMRVQAAETNANLSPEELKTRAEAGALEDAQTNALNRIMTIQSSLGSMNEIVTKHPEVGDELREWIQSAKPEEYVHSPDGVCSTSIKLNLQEPFDIIRKYAETKEKKPAKKKSVPKKAPTKKPVNEESAAEPFPAAPLPDASEAPTEPQP